MRLAETVGITRSSPDYYALELGNHVLAGAFYATRLYRDLREHRGLVYHVGSSLRMTKTRGMLELEYACDPENVARARAIIVRDLDEMRTTRVRAAELLQARRLLLSSMPLDEPVHAAARYLQLGADDIQAAFARWLQPEHLAQVVLGPHPATR